MQNQVDVAPAIAEFLICDLVIGAVLGFLDDRQWPKRLGQKLEPLGVYCDLAEFGLEGETFDAEDIAEVKQLLERIIVEAFGKVVSTNVQLHRARRILQFEECR